MNRGPSLKQLDYQIPTYSLLTWTPSTENFVRPLIYSFKGGRAALASEKLAALFLSEYTPAKTQGLAPETSLVPAPFRSFDHSAIWTQALAQQTRWSVAACLHDKTAREERQKELRAGERGLRRFGLKEHFAMLELEQLASKRIVFADDVVTSGSTAMAAYMALGDPVNFEVWSLVARPRLATKQGAC
jgi:predicted amidophosphoribosyltransferase